jgi:hypothetical protein
MAETVQHATLRRALELAGGLRNLASATGVTGGLIYKALESQDVPDWLFLRLADFINRSETRDAPPPIYAERHQGTDTKQ